MSEILRLTLVSHALTAAMSAGRFPRDEPLSDLGRRQASQSGEFGRYDRAYCGPELRTRQTAALLGFDAEVDSLLADMDHGRWAGSSLGEVGSADLAAWMTDPQAAPHGAESVVDLIARVRGWLAALTAEPARVVAVSHPAVVRAAVLVALDAPPTSFWRIDIVPMSRTLMHQRAGRWALRCG